MDKTTTDVLFDFPDVIERAKRFLAKEGIPDDQITLTMGKRDLKIPWTRR